MQVINNNVSGKCDSCPFVGELDNKHKIVAFIVKKPPAAKSMATGKKIKEENVPDKKAKKDKKDKKKE